MAVTKKEFSCLSSDGIHNLSGCVYIPDKAPIGFYQIVHGMTEHMGRYDRFMRDMAEEGYICFGYDHLGHGNTARDASELGFIAHKGGWELLCRDVKTFSDAVFTEYQGDFGRDLPYFLMGHSMGSFVVRLAAAEYVNPDKLIVMGTGGANSAAGAGIAIIKLIKLFKGEKYISDFVYKLAFGSYNSKFEKEEGSDEKSWLTTDVSVRQRYINDGFCNFKFTVSAMEDLMRLLKNSNSSVWFRSVSSEMPILLVAGEDDPVGNYGKGVLEVESKLKKNGKNVKCILYKGARHEILNDFVYDSVKNDILRFLK